MKNRFIFLILLQFFFEASFASDVAVCLSGCDFASISAAVSAAKQNDVIHVKQGTYKEHGIVISKTLSIIGDDANSTIVDGDNQGHIFTIFKADDVTIKGLTIQNTGVSYTAELSGIRVTESKNCKILKNRFLNDTYAVYLENSERCSIDENDIVGTAKDEAAGGNGIHVWYGNSHLISHNSIQGHRDGIYLEFAQQSIVRSNIVTKNIRYGLHFMSSSETEYHQNRFFGNGAGVAVMYSRKIKMHDNEFSTNTGPAAYGLLMKEVHESEVFRNSLVGNTVAIFMEGSNRSRFENNNIIDNGWGLRIMGDCENNTFEKNNYINNTFDVTTNSDHSWNTFKNNFWSQYEGYDINRDGIGDKAYRPVSLSSVIIERVDSGFILMNSFFFKVMDSIERTLPSLIPEPLKDESPSMKRIEIPEAKKVESHD